MTRPSTDLEKAFADAHEQLVERDQRINDLELENAALREHLDGILATRAWRVATRVHAARAKFNELSRRDYEA